MSVHRYRARTVARELLLLAFAVAFCAPVYLLVVLAFKSSADIFSQPLALPSDPDTSNFRTAWQGTAETSMGRGLVNSVVISVSSVVLLVIVGSLAAYTIARRQSKLATGLYLLFLSGIVMPYQLGVIPLYAAMDRLGLVGTLPGMILLDVGLLMPLTVFLYAGFIRALPRQYEEAAQVDGAGIARTYFRVVFPLLRPVTGTVAVLAGLVTWNEFFLPLIFLGGTPNAPLPVVIYSFVGEWASQWNVIFAAVTISIVPMIAFYAVAQKQLIKGFASGIRG